ncbi:hypothetical protein [Massilia sp. TN1-12]|uniref:hypothetical protein n=1 Tax=Massilia paldalensis TaxID=3377675 RepID=UPI00384C79EA
MKKLTLAAVLWLLALCSGTAYAEGNSLIITQRNSADTGNILRTLPNPPTDGLLIWNKSTNLPSYLTVGSGLVSSNGVLSALPTTQINADWNATSGAAQILNKPALKTVAITGQAADLTGLAPVATSGSYSDLSNKPVLFSGSYADLSGKPTLFSGAYADLTGKPAFAAVATTGSYNDLTDKPTIPAPYSFDFGEPVARTLALSTAYQASNTAKPSIITISTSCTASLTLTAGGTCTLQVRTSPTSGLNCSNGTLYAVNTNANTGTLAVGLGLNQRIGSTVDIKLRAGAFFILCPVSGTFTVDAAVDQTAG